MKKDNSFKAWAIATGTGSYIGRYWWFGDKPPKIPRQFEGCILCLFTTRKIAREHLPDAKKGFKTAKVVRVKIEVTDIG